MLGARTSRREPSASCVAAVIVKPKARLCEPWVLVRWIRRAAKRRHLVCKQVPLRVIAVAPSGLDTPVVVDLARLFWLVPRPGGTKCLWNHHLQHNSSLQRSETEARLAYHYRKHLPPLEPEPLTSCGLSRAV
jgi:hypothetical protein